MNSGDWTTLAPRPDLVPHRLALPFLTRLGSWLEDGVQLLLVLALAIPVYLWMLWEGMRGPEEARDG